MCIITSLYEIDSMSSWASDPKYRHTAKMGIDHGVN